MYIATFLTSFAFSSFMSESPLCALDTTQPLTAPWRQRSTGENRLIAYLSCNFSSPLPWTVVSGDPLVPEKKRILWKPWKTPKSQLDWLKKGKMRRCCHEGMGWSVAISCFWEIGKQIQELCFAAQEQDCIHEILNVLYSNFSWTIKNLRLWRLLFCFSCFRKYWVRFVAQWPCWTAGSCVGRCAWETGSSVTGCSLSASGRGLICRLLALLSVLQFPYLSLFTLKLLLPYI